MRTMKTTAVVAMALLSAPLALAAPASAAICLRCPPDGGGGGNPGTHGRPAIVRQQSDNVGQGIHMDTEARLSPAAGLVDGTTHTYTTWWGVGGHGSVAVELLDRDGNVIAVTNPQTYGVDAKSIFWGRHERYDHWSQTFSPTVTARAVDEKILHTSATRNNFLADLRQARDAACAVWAVAQPGKTCPLGPVT